jgi:tripartite-type tricarboxylate transporter receptor subunit TctC
MLNASCGGALAPLLPSSRADPEGLDMPRHSLKRLIAIAAAALATSSAIAQTWPTRPVTMVVPFAAGSASDTVGRILAAGLSEALGQQVLVENIGGAGGMTGTARVANAPPDGYQFVLGGVDTFAMNQSLYKKLPYQVVSDFIPVGLVVEQPILLIARNELPASTVPQFINYAKANQARMQYGSAGVGSGSHLTCARMNAAMGIDATHIPYRGSAQALQDLVAGRIDYFCALGAAAMTPLGGGTAKAIAILSRERSPLFPNVASAHEQGLTNFDSYFWSGFFLPKGAPADVTQRLLHATASTLDNPRTQERLRSAGVTIVAPERRSPDYLKKFLAEEIAQWAEIIKASGVSLD